MCGDSARDSTHPRNVAKAHAMVARAHAPPPPPPHTHPPTHPPNHTMTAAQAPRYPNSKATCVSPYLVPALQPWDAVIVGRAAVPVEVLSEGDTCHVARGP